MAMIDALSAQSDLAEALVQAQIWQETLRDQGIRNDDPRRKRLAAMIRTLEEKLTPQQGPPAELVEFRRLVQAIADALESGDRAGNVADARQAVEKADVYLQDHRDALMPYCQRFLRLKARLQELDAVIAGVSRIRRWLDEADGAAAAGNVTLALETEAKARFSALLALLTKAEAEELDLRDHGLVANIRFARGKRAVADAQRCHEAGDKEERNRQVRRAFAELMGLPEPRIAPILDEVRGWKEEIQKAQEQETTQKSVARPSRGRIVRIPPKTRPQDKAAPHPPSPLNREIELRDRYESILDPYGRADTKSLADACLSLETMLDADDAESSKPLRNRVQSILFAVLERDVSQQIKQVQAARSEQEALERLSHLRETVDFAERWRASHRWMVLDAAIRQEGGRYAARWLQEAHRLVKQDRLKEAAEKADAAERLGDAKTARQARALCETIAAETKLRRNQEAENEAWERIRTLRATPRSQMLLYKELELFGRRFPNSSRSAQVDELRRTTRRAVEDKIADALSQVAASLDKEDWLAARKQLELLQYLPIPPSSAAAFKQLQKRVADLKIRAEEDFQALGSQRRLFSEQDVIAVLAALRRILAMDPEHEDARALLEKARRNGAIRAHKLLAAAAVFRERSPEIYRERLRRVLQLDPDGPDGVQARTLLDEL
jgi:hypothetical protein